MRYLLLSIVLVCGCGDVSVSSAMDDSEPRFVAPEPARGPVVLISFQGVDTYLTYSLGAAEAAYESYAEFRGTVPARLFLSANSGGAVLAAYLTCKGFSVAALQAARTFMKALPAGVVNDQSALLKLPAVLLSPKLLDRKHNRIIEVLKPLIPEDCAFLHEIMIGAGNLEVVSRRVKWDRIAGDADLTQRRFDQETYMVTDRLGVLGKACTYFATPLLYALLAKIPAATRLCDLRLIKTGADLFFAVLATVSEPTYFEPVEEVDRGKLELAFHRYGTPPRVYPGGFILPGPARDFIRLFPDAQVFGTGRPSYYDANVFPPDARREVLREWFGIYIDNLVYLEQSAMDVVVPLTSQMLNSTRPSDDVARKKAYSREICEGHHLALACFKDPQSCPPMPKSALRPMRPQPPERQGHNPVPPQEVPERQRVTRWDLAFDYRPLLHPKGEDCRLLE
jgi:hypothetical protein